MRASLGSGAPYSGGRERREKTDLRCVGFAESRTPGEKVRKMRFCPRARPRLREKICQTGGVSRLTDWVKRWPHMACSASLMD